MKRVSLLKAAAGVVVAGLLSACYDEASQAPMPNITAPPVEAVQARFGGLPLVERLSGTVRAENQVSLYPEFSGRIAAVHAQDGDTVTAGQVLVELTADQVREQVFADGVLEVSVPLPTQPEAAVRKVEIQEPAKSGKAAA